MQRYWQPLATLAASAHTRHRCCVRGYKADAQVLAINGCPGATSEVWDAVHSVDVPELPLQTLSAVGCKRLRSCWLGLQPAQLPDRAAQQALLSVGMYSPPVPVSTSWREVPVALTGEPPASSMHQGTTPGVSRATRTDSDQLQVLSGAKPYLVKRKQIYQEQCPPALGENLSAACTGMTAVIDGEREGC